MYLIALLTFPAGSLYAKPAYAALSQFLSLMSSVQWNLKDRWTMRWTISLPPSSSFLLPWPALKGSIQQKLLSHGMIHCEWRKHLRKRMLKTFPFETYQRGKAPVSLSLYEGIPPLIEISWMKTVDMECPRRLHSNSIHSSRFFSSEFIREGRNRLWNKDTHPTNHKTEGIFC